MLLPICEVPRIVSPCLTFSRLVSRAMSCCAWWTEVYRRPKSESFFIPVPCIFIRLLQGAFIKGGLSSEPRGIRFSRTLWGIRSVLLTHYKMFDSSKCKKETNDFEITPNNEFIKILISPEIADKIYFNTYIDIRHNV